MWCANCRSDVAAEVSTDNRHVNCAHCGGPIATPLSGRTLSRTQQARDLLERWSRDRTPETVATAADAAKSHAAAASNRPATVYAIQTDDAVPDVPDKVHSSGSGIEPHGPHRRLDDGHMPGESSGRVRGSGHVPTTGAEAAQRDARPSKRTTYRRDAGHAVAGPHLKIASKPPTKWVPLIGQSMAYIGVLGLMAGACMVILGYFRGPATYAPTGWLITMAGQMLLFLGVVTLVSTGMEETTNTVANRIDRLDEKLLRIEQATSRLRGPSSGTEGFKAEGNTGTTASPQREISRAG